MHSFRRAGKSIEDKIFIFVGIKGNPDAVARFFRAFIRYLFRAFPFKREELDKIVADLPKKKQPMFESTYDMLIREGEIKGEAIGIQKGEAIGERRRSLETVLDGLVIIPAPGDAEIAALSRLPLPFVYAMRECFSFNDIHKAQQIAVGLFADLPRFSSDDVKKVKEIVKAAWKQSPKA